MLFIVKANSYDPYVVYNTLPSVYALEHSKGVMYINEFHEDYIYIL